MSDAEDDAPAELEVKRRNAASAAPVDVALLRNACLEAASDVLSDKDAANTLVHPIGPVPKSTPTTETVPAALIHPSHAHVEDLVSDFADLM